MAPPLFRAESMQACAQAGLGPIRISSSLPLRWIAAGLVVAAALVWTWLTLASFTRTLALSGTVQPASGVQVLRAGAHATVLALLARDGEVLSAGAPVAVLGDIDGGGGGGVRRTVSAPEGGRVSAVLARPGARVTPSSVLAHLEPVAARWHAELAVPAFALGALPDGLALRLRLLDASGPDPVWLAGHVRGAAREPIADGAATAASPSTSPSTSPPASPPASPHYRVTVTLDDGAGAAVPARALRSGLRVQAVLPLERRRLVGWLFGAPTTDAR
ncbi:MAG: HlyD family efflux transporter periplasmic adaptor subunit [Rubrivivax sp.]